MNSEREMTELLEKMVAIPSVNPGFANAPAEFTGEERLADFILKWGAEHHLETRKFLAAPGRPCVMLAAGPEDAPVLAVSAHMDTVWTEMAEPFILKRKGNCLYGLGAVDDKGPLAAAMWTLLQLSRKPMPLRFVVMATCDEEYGLLGIRHMIPGQILPDGVIIAEATALRVITAHKGSSRWEFTTRGRGVHSSLVPQGENAVYKGARLVTALEDYSRELLQEPPHLLLGTNTLCVAVIQGGTQPSIVPDRCVCRINVRSLPGETAESIRNRLEQALHARHMDDYELSWYSFDASALDTSPDLPMVARLRKTLAAAGLDDRPCGVPFATESFRAAEAGCPAIVFGPGDIDTAHTSGECMAIEQFHQYPHILSEMIENYSWQKSDFRVKSKEAR